jgi:hypothetical protein
MTYLLACETQGLFSFNPSQKANLIGVILVFFLVLIFCSGSFFVMKEHYGANAKYLIDNLSADLTGIAYFTALNGYRNIILGSLHGLLDDDYEIKIGLILCVEFSFIVWSCGLLRSKKYFQSKSKVWVNQFTALIRFILVWTFFFDEKTFDENGTVYEIPHLLLIYGLIGMFIVSILTESTIKFLEIKRILIISFGSPK